MRDRAACCPFVEPTAKARTKSIADTCLPGRMMWTWVSRLCGKLSARDLIALTAAAAANTKNPGSKPEHEPCQPQDTQEPSQPVNITTPAINNLNYTQAWNPVHAKNRLQQQQQQQHMATKDQWKFGISETDYILAHEVSRKFPDAYAYVIRRICERAGVPVPDVFTPASGSKKEP